MRVFIKGGTWRNSEDEVLKAAIMKYGKNNWDRVASLLNRKSAKACKARWYEWLDPSIKKTEWTREEEEKLLHLAKIMPTQWRTIAPIIGRTPAQCLEHYERLLDQAQEREGISVADAESDPRRLRAGEIDPNPETRPAVPDRVDMDEDEKEMLSEARARLANTQGKKAKRKARERQLEEARRLAALQKRRELKAAGIVVRDGMSRKKKRQFVDYNKENPFYKEAPAGFFDTSEEETRSKQMTETASSQFINLSLQQLMGKRKELEEQKLRKQDLKKAKEKAKQDLPTLVKRIGAANDPGHISQRSEIQLPAPQIGDRELEEIGKMGYSLEDIERSGSSSSSSSEATSRLLSDYKATPMMTPAGMRTPMRTPARRDTILESARDLAALEKQQTPLVGGSNVRMQSAQSSDFGGVTPRLKSAAATPNPLATPGATPLMGRHGSMTPAMSVGGMATPTPVRDSLRINEELALSEGLVKGSLRQSLMQLPAPSSDKYRFTVAVPKEGDTESEEVVEDAGMLRKRREQARQAKKEERLKRRSQAVQRNLPRPRVFNGDIFDDVGDADQSGDADAKSNDCANPSKMVQREFATLLQHDIQNHPMQPPKKKRKVVPLREEFSSDEMESARKLIREELQQNGGNMVSSEEFGRAWEDVMRNGVFDLKSGELILRPTEKQRVQFRRHQYEELATLCREYDQRASKLEKKLEVLTAGYAKRSIVLSGEIEELSSQTQEELRSIEAFHALQDLESLAAPVRLSSLREEVHAVQQREAELQSEYRSLKDEYGKLQQSLQQI